MPDRKARHLSYTVLLVDDDESIRRLLHVVLGRTWAFRVIGEADSAARAIELLSDPSFVRPEVILLDYLMPHVSGVEAAPRLRELSPTSKIVMATVVPERCEEHRKRGTVDGCLDKGLLPPELVFRLYKMLHPTTTFDEPEDLDAEPDPRGARP